MVYLFLDLEMYRANRKAFFRDAKIIAIGYAKVNRNIHDFVNEHNTYPKVKILSEWKMGNEKNMLTLFLDFLKDLNRNRLYIVGFGLTKYDIPFLIQRLVHHKIGTLDELNEFFHQNLMYIDLRLIGLLLNKMKFKGSGLNDTIRRINYADPKLKKVLNEKSGAIVHELYVNRKYREIEKHLENDIKETIYLYRMTSIISNLLTQKFTN